MMSIYFQAAPAATDFSQLKRSSFMRDVMSRVSTVLSMSQLPTSRFTSFRLPTLLFFTTIVSSRLLYCPQDDFHDYHVVRQLSLLEDDGSAFDLADYFDRSAPCFLFNNMTYLAFSSQVGFIQSEGQNQRSKKGFGGVAVLFR